MSSGRLFEIVYLLLERRQMTAAELAGRFEVSVRTIYRDIDALSAAGVPVYTTQGKGGGVALMDHYILDRAAFTEEEQRQLLTALQSLPEAARAGADETLAKLSGLFRRRETDWLQVDLSRWGSVEADQRKFEALKTAILDRRAAAFTYVSSYGLTTDRRVLPARLVFKGQSWYLQAYCTEKEDYRTFKVSRILKLSVLDERFSRPLSPPPIENSGEPCPFCVTVRLRFTPAMAYRVYDEFDESCVTREPTGNLLVAVTLPDDNWLYGYLLSFGAMAEVLDPPAVRRRLAKMAADIWRKNAEPDMGCQGIGRMMEPSSKEVSVMNPNGQTFCQSCGMPLCDPSVIGTEQDGSPSEHYCKYCYENGAFTGDMTMEEMIDFCVGPMVESTPGMTAEQAKDRMAAFFPTLLRWKKD